MKSFNRSIALTVCLLLILTSALAVVGCSSKSNETAVTAPPPAPSPPAERKLLYYRNPMDSRITSPVPKKDNMGMDYIPVYEGDTTPLPPIGG